jgi:hypothetical protein
VASPVDLSIARCVKCNYLLRDLPSHRCPECGRDFDPLDESTVNTARRAWRFRQWFLARLYWPSALFVALPMLLFCWMFSYPDPYYMGIVLLPAVGIPLMGLLLVWPKLHHTARGFRRSTLICIVLLVCCSIWFVELPLRIRFAISLPAMNRELRIAQQMHASRTRFPTRVGLYEIGQIEAPRYDTVWRFYRGKSSEVGFGYSDIPVTYAGSNAGAGGHLCGGWYWFSDD